MKIGQWVDLIGMKGLGLLFASMGGLFLAQVPSVYDSEVEFQSKAISTTGTVVKTKTETHLSGGGGIVPLTSRTDYISTVKFQSSQGETVNFITKRACRSLRSCKDKKVPILYDPTSPTDARVDTGATPKSKAIVGSIGGAIFLIVGIIFIGINPDNQQRKLSSKSR